MMLADYAGGKTKFFSSDHPLPGALTSMDSWVVWRLEQAGDRVTKVPYDPKNVRLHASTTNPSTWGPYSSAVAACTGDPGIAGIGLVLTAGCGIIGIDLDHCVRREGKVEYIEPWANDIIGALGGYWEYSPSGEGLRGFIFGKLPAGSRSRAGSVEMYDGSGGRYLTITGDVYDSNAEISTPDEYFFARIVDKFLNGGKLYGSASKTGKCPGNGKVQGGAATAPTGDFTAIGGVIDQSAGPPFDKHEALLENDPKYKKTWMQTRTDLKDSSSSGYCMSLANYALSSDWTTQETINLMVAWRRKHGHPIDADRLDKYQRTIHTVKASLAADQHQAQIEETLTQIETGELSPQDDSSRAAILETIRDIVKMPVARICQEGRENAVYVVHMDDGQKRLIGGVAAMSKQATWRNVSIEHGGTAPRTIKSAKWDAVLDAMLAVVEVTECAETTTAENLGDMVEQVLQYVSDDKKEAVPLSLPFAEEGYTYISLPGMVRRLAQLREEVPQKQVLMAMLKNQGWEAHNVSVRVQGKVFSRGYWRKNELTAEK